MAAYNKFNCFVADLDAKVHNFTTDTIMVCLTNTAPVATDTRHTDITELAAGNGYTTGGNAAAVTSCAQTAGVLKLILANPATWTASGGAMGPFEYAVVYNSSSTNQSLICWFDYGSAITLSSGDNFSLEFDPTGGIFQLA